MKILYLRPVADSEQTGLIAARLREAVEPSTEISVAAMGDEAPRHLEYHSYESLIVKDLVTRVRHASKAGYHAVVLGGFYDMGLRASREVSGTMVVTAPCESATAIARMLGQRFSVLVGRKKWIPYVVDNIHRYGHRDALASVRDIDLGVEAIRDDPEETKRRIREQASAAIEDDGAEVVILGCTAKHGLYRELTDSLGVPVIDSMLAALKMAECLADTAKRFHWFPSRVGGSEPPPESELEAWNLFSEKDASEP